MKQKKDLNAALEEIAALKEKFNNIKKESEEFLVRAKKLSDTGIHEAKELIEMAKANLKSFPSSFAEISQLFSKVSGPGAKATPTQKKVSSKKMPVKKMKSNKSISKNNRLQ